MNNKENKAKDLARMNERAYRRDGEIGAGWKGFRQSSQTIHPTLLLEPEISSYHSVLSNQEFYTLLHHLRDLNLNQRS